jgi:hypothetical protein
MTIRPYLGEKEFDLEILQAMGRAFEMLCEMLRLTPHVDDPATRRVAEAIIKAAAAGETKDEDILRIARADLGVGKSPE